MSSPPHTVCAIKQSQVCVVAHGAGYAVQPWSVAGATPAVYVAQNCPVVQPVQASVEPHCDGASSNRGASMPPPLGEDE